MSRTYDIPSLVFISDGKINIQAHLYLTNLPKRLLDELVPYLFQQLVSVASQGSLQFLT